MTKLADFLNKKFPVLNKQNNKRYFFVDPNGMKREFEWVSDTVNQQEVLRLYFYPGDTNRYFEATDLISAAQAHCQLVTVLDNLTDNNISFRTQLNNAPGQIRDIVYVEISPEGYLNLQGMMNAEAKVQESKNAPSSSLPLGASAGLPTGSADRTKKSPFTLAWQNTSPQGLFSIGTAGDAKGDAKGDATELKAASFSIKGGAITKTNCSPLGKICRQTSTSDTIIQITDLLKKGTDINERDAMGNTALTEACDLTEDVDNIEAITALIHYGADLLTKGGTQAFKYAHENHAKFNSKHAKKRLEILTAALKMQLAAVRSSHVRQESTAETKGETKTETKVETNIEIKIDNVEYQEAITKNEFRIKLKKAGLFEPEKYEPIVLKLLGKSFLADLGFIKITEQQNAEISLIALGKLLLNAISLKPNNIIDQNILRFFVTHKEPHFFAGKASAIDQKITAAQNALSTAISQINMSKITHFMSAVVHEMKIANKDPSQDFPAFVEYPSLEDALIALEVERRLYNAREITALTSDVARMSLS